MTGVLRLGWFAERWNWPPTVTLKQPLPFVRWAPSVFAAVDKMREDDIERQQRQQRTRDMAAQQTGPRFNGGL